MRFGRLRRHNPTGGSTSSRALSRPVTQGQCVPALLLEQEAKRLLALADSINQPSFLAQMS